MAYLVGNPITFSVDFDRQAACSDFVQGLETRVEILCLQAHNYCELSVFSLWQRCAQQPFDIRAVPLYWFIGAFLIKFQHLPRLRVEFHLAARAENLKVLHVAESHF